MQSAIAHLKRVVAYGAFGMTEFPASRGNGVRKQGLSLKGPALLGFTALVITTAWICLFFFVILPLSR